MKIPRLLLAIGLALSWFTPGHAQLIQSKKLTSGSASFSVNFTQDEPLNILVSNATQSSGNGNPPTASVTFQVDGQQIGGAGGLVFQLGTTGNGDSAVYAQILSANFTVNPSITAGAHTITINTFSGNGGVTIIAPNEPYSGAQSAIATINDQIAALQAAESVDANQLALLQTWQANVNNQLPQLQAAVQAANAAISSLQNQLTAIQTSLQNQIDTHNAQIIDLTRRVAALENLSTQQQTQIGTLQTQASNAASSITSLQQNQSVTNTRLQNDEAAIAQLQAQVAALQQQTGNDNSAAIAQLQQQQAAMLAQQQADEATAAQQQTQLAALQSQADSTAASIATLQQQQAATSAQQQADEATLAALRGQVNDILASITDLRSQIAANQTAQAQINTNLQNQINALQNASGNNPGLQAQVDRLQKSQDLTRNLTYAGIGVGVAGFAAGIDAIFFNDDNSASSSHSTPAAPKGKR